MTCHEVQLKLSLYLYGELDFASEEKLEEHLAGCAFCQRALARDKAWHTAAASEQLDVPLDLLSQCRQDLRTAIKVESSSSNPSRRRWWNGGWSWPAALRITPTRWSYQLAVSSFLIFLGFAGSRVLDRYAGSGGLHLATSDMGFLPSSGARIRDIQSNGQDQVRILVDQIDQREVIGSLDDRNVRQWLLVATRDSADPSIRVDSVEMLKNQSGADVRDALLNRVEKDPNAAVRLKALESVRSFASEAPTRQVLKFVLEHDTDPNVRSAAIDVLAGSGGRVQLTPELALTLENLARSEDDDYVRTRCLELLRGIDNPFGVY